MRRLFAFAVAAAVLLALGCGDTKTEYTGPAITPLTGKKAAGNYGPPGEGPEPGGPTGPPKPPGSR
jgi:hypothetical protein